MRQSLRRSRQLYFIATKATLDDGHGVKAATRPTEIAMAEHPDHFDRRNYSFGHRVHPGIPVADDYANQNKSRFRRASNPDWRQSNRNNIIGKLVARNNPMPNTGSDI